MQPLRALLLTTAFALAACTGGGAATPSPLPSARPTPTPIAAPVSSAQEAAALVIATNPLFAGTTAYSSEMIGASRWWKATSRDAGGYAIELTIGWGDCEAGCINRHLWTFVVTPDGAVSKVSESGDEVPTDLPG